MATSTSRRGAGSSSTKSITRFAHPFFSTVSPTRRKPVPELNGAKRMTEHVQAHLEKIPPVKGDSTMLLSDVIGQQASNAIENEGTIRFHAVGDTGHENGHAQEFVAAAMTADFDINKPETSPAFFLHLGDVIYYDNTDRGYHAQFYVPYKTYPGKIVAIPGNHDGELFRFDGKPTGQSKTLQAFQQNFCQPPGKTNITSGTILRQMVSQPGVYWRLNCPLVDIVGLYSNVAENPGYIQSAAIGTAQAKWLTKTLGTIKTERTTSGKRKALIIAVHHPPISKGSHSSSVQMLADIDASCAQSNIMPDVVLAAHSHDYERFTRFVPFGNNQLKTPYLVVGSGGRGLSPKVEPANGQRDNDHQYEKSLRGYGYLYVTISQALLKMEFFQVDEHDGTKKLFDTVPVPLT